MASGPLLYRMTVSTFSYLYVIISVLWVLAVFASVGLEHIPFELFVYGFLRGIILFSIGLLGIYAVKKRDGGKMKIFGVIVVIIIIIQFLQLIVFGVDIQQRTYFIHNIFHYWIGSHNTSLLSRLYVNLIQTHYKCCGSLSYKDWGSSSSIPYSCCEDLSRCNSYYQQGCTEKIASSILYWTVMLVAVYICNIVLHIFTATFALLLAKKFNEPDGDVNSLAQQPHYSKYSISTTNPYAAPQRAGPEYLVTVPGMFY